MSVKGNSERTISDIPLGPSIVVTRFLQVPVRRGFVLRVRWTRKLLIERPVSGGFWLGGPKPICLL